MHKFLSGTSIPFESLRTIGSAGLSLVTVFVVNEKCRANIDVEVYTRVFICFPLLSRYGIYWNLFLFRVKPQANGKGRIPCSWQSNQESCKKVYDYMKIAIL